MLQVSRFFYINIYFEGFVVLTKANETSYHWLCADEVLQQHQHYVQSKQKHVQRKKCIHLT